MLATRGSRVHSHSSFLISCYDLLPLAPKSGHLTCYYNRTYDVLVTRPRCSCWQDRQSLLQISRQSTQRDTRYRPCLCFRQFRCGSLFGGRNNWREKNRGVYLEHADMVSEIRFRHRNLIKRVLWKTHIYLVLIPRLGIFESSLYFLGFFIIVCDFGQMIYVFIRVYLRFIAVFRSFSTFERRSS